MPQRFRPSPSVSGEGGSGAPQIPCPDSRLLRLRDRSTKVGRSWFWLIEPEKQFLAYRQNLRAKDDFLLGFTWSVSWTVLTGFSDSPVERQGFPQQGEEIGEPQPRTNPPYTR